MANERPPIDSQLQQVIDAGLMTPADGAAVDAWAEDLAKRFQRGEITAAEVNRAIADRLARDLAKRGAA